MTISPIPQSDTTNAAVQGTEVLWHVTVLSNFFRGYDKYSRTYSKSAIAESTFPDRFYLLRESEIGVGIRKARGLLNRLALPGNRLLALRTRVRTATLHENVSTGVGLYVEKNNIDLDGIAWIEQDLPHGRLISVSVEEATALSLFLLQPNFRPYRDLLPRTFSVLPIARGCQARCPFCFSEASVSAEQDHAQLEIQRVRQFAHAAASRGANRYVITGGGEPGLVPHAKLSDFIAAGRATIGKTVLITNGHHLARQNEGVRADMYADYHDAGLTVLAVSTHHHIHSKNAQLMGLETNATAIADTWRRGRERWPNLGLRFTCVLQEGGIDSANALEDYVAWASGLGVEELCFKELYVSTSVESVYHRESANEWSRQHQVPLSIVLDVSARHGFDEESRLPWGSPIFRGSWAGNPLKIAAYTEPSLFWERTQGIARSWNLMADGQCLVSLEDRASVIKWEEVA